MEPEEVLQEPTSTIVTLDTDSFQLLADISQRTDLLANRIDVILLLSVFFVALFTFALLRYKP